MAFVLPSLPYEKGALAPYISEQTLEFHYGKHHAGYVTNLNKLIEGSDLAEATLEEVVKTSAGSASKAGIFNNAAQVWNHTFYWSSMKPNGGGLPTGALASKIDNDFGSYENFKTTFKTTGVGQFGSGWAWLVLDGTTLKVTKTANADLPIVHGQIPLLTMDVWEHAYYLDYQNRRPDYAQTWLDSLVNWDFASENFAKATA